MKTVRTLSCVLAMLALATSSTGQVFSPVTDNFSSSSNWGSANYNLGSSSGTIAIDTVTNQRVNFSASMGANDFLQAAMPFSYTAPTGSDWSVSLAVTNLFASSASANQSVQVGLFVSNTTGLSWSSTPPITHDYVKLVLAADSTNNQYIHGGLHVNGSAVTALSGQSNPKWTYGISQTSGTLVVSYDSTNKVITTGYNFNGTLYQFASYGINSSAGTTANSAFDSPPSFTVSLYAQANSTSGSAFNLSSGTAYLDNFTTTSSTTAMTAVPEPSTYAALAGLGALGLAFWRRQRRTALR